MRKKKRHTIEELKKSGSLSLLQWPSNVAILLAKKLLEQGKNVADMPAAFTNAHSILLINQTKLSNALMCQPQQRNTKGRIFGGFLMRRAFELAFTTAYKFLGQQPLFKEVDRVEFKLPVEVGDLLQFSSCILYTSNNVDGVDQDYFELCQLSSPGLGFSRQQTFTGGPRVHVEVVASVTRPEEGTSKVSNTFHFTFEAVDASKPVCKVVPSSMEQAHSVVCQVDINFQQQEDDHAAVKVINTPEQQDELKK